MTLFDDRSFFQVEGRQYKAYRTSLEARVDYSIQSTVATEEKQEQEWLTVFDKLENERFSAEWLQHLIAQSLGEDDVLVAEFLETVLIQGVDEDEIKPIAGLDLVLREYGILRLGFSKSVQLIPQGPYLRQDGYIWRVCRVYDDTNGAFLLAVDQDEHGRFQAAKNGVHEWGNCAVAVDSRLSADAGPTKPLSGWRVAVKDVFDLEGVKTSLGNRAYLQLYPPAANSADAVKAITDKGAVVVGKTKLSMLLSREEPAEAVDFQAPWNPRGDGYQAPGGSSNGSAAAVAAYDWLDIGIGTDTTGSIRRPAQCNGVFGLRPSYRAVSRRGMFKVFDRFDVPGVFSRDLQKLVDFADAWYADKLTQSKKRSPYSVALILDSLPDPNDTKQQTSLVRMFAEGLAAFLEAELRQVDMVSLWNETMPSEAKGKGLHDYLEKVGESTFLYANYHSTARFRDEYMQKYDQNPYVSQFVEWRWSIGKKIKAEDYKDGIERMRVYEHWLLNEVLRVSTSRTLVVTQSEAVRPNYRHTPPPDYFVQPAWHQWWLSSICGAPEVVLPAGQILYDSKISGSREYLPVMADVLGGPNSDKDLLDCLNEFFKFDGRARFVTTGKHMYLRSPRVLGIGDDRVKSEKQMLAI